MTTSKRLRPSTPVVMTSGTAMIVLGIASALFASAPFDGFVKGLFQGAGVMLILLGVYALSTLRHTLRHDRGAREGGLEDGWLPSRDGDR